MKSLSWREESKFFEALASLGHSRSAGSCPHHSQTSRRQWLCRENKKDAGQHCHWCKLQSQICISKDTRGRGAAPSFSPSKALYLYFINPRFFWARRAVCGAAVIPVGRNKTDALLDSACHMECYGVAMFGGCASDLHDNNGIEVIVKHWTRDGEGVMPPNVPDLYKEDTLSEWIGTLNGPHA